MIVLDTNVVSELMHASPDARLLDWLDAQPAADAHLTAVTAAELRYGATRLPAGKRRTELLRRVGAVLEEDFAGRVLPFDLAAATEYGEIVTARESAGRQIAMADAEIASICRSRGATLVTRNTPDFELTGIDLLNPFTG